MQPAHLLPQMQLEQEQHYAFTHFIVHLAPKLCGLLYADLPLWTDYVVQLAQNSTVLQHAICAVSAFHCASSTHTSLVAHQLPTFALDQYAKALRGLRDHPIFSCSNEIFALVGVFLTLCESIRGNYTAAVTHIRGVLEASAGEDLGSLPSSSDVVHTNFARTCLLRLRRQLAELNLIQFPQPLPKAFGTWHAPPAKLSSYTDARHSFEGFLDDNIESLRTFFGYIDHSRAHSVPLTGPPSDIHQRFSLWQSLFSRFQDEEQLYPGNITVEDRVTGLTLRMYTTTMRILLHRRFELAEMGYDEFLDDAAAILGYAAVLIQHPENPPSMDGPGPKLSLMGLSPLFPLYLVAHRCRDPCLRRRAVDLLLTQKWRDGLWNSDLTGQVCKRIIELEEEKAKELVGFDGEITAAGQIPDAARIVHVWPRIGQGRVLEMDFMLSSQERVTPTPKPTSPDYTRELSQQ